MATGKQKKCQCDVATINEISDILDKCTKCDGKISSWSVTSDVLNKVRLPCKFKEHGCCQTFSFDDLRKHEVDCNFTPFQCPVVLDGNRRCDWTGGFVKFHLHIYSKHDKLIITPNSNTMIYVSYELNLKLEPSYLNHSVLFIDKYNTVLLLHLEKNKQEKTSVSVQLVDKLMLGCYYEVKKYEKGQSEPTTDLKNAFRYITLYKDSLSDGDTFELDSSFGKNDSVSYELTFFFIKPNNNIYNEASSDHATCEYNKNGCPIRTTADIIALHEVYCVFRHIHCPEQDCKWIGGYAQLWLHYKSHNIVGENNVIESITFKPPQVKTFLITAGNDRELFLLYVKIQLGGRIQIEIRSCRKCCVEYNYNIDFTFEIRSNLQVITLNGLFKPVEECIIKEIKPDTPINHITKMQVTLEPNLKFFNLTFID